MANIADLIANRNQELEDFKQKKQEERTEAYERRDAAVMEVTSDPEKIQGVSGPARADHVQCGQYRHSMEAAPRRNAASAAQKMGRAWAENTRG